MRLRIVWIFILITFMLLIFVSYIGFNYKKIIEPKEDNSENYYDFFIQRLRFEQDKIVIERDSNKGEFKSLFGDYFKLFDCLSVERGWSVDWYYFLNNDAGRPVFFASRTGENVDSLKSIFANRYIFRYVDSIGLMNHIKVVENEKGYFQLLVFHLIGDDFGKFWHSSYGNIDIICSKRMLRQISNRSDYLHDFDFKMRKKIMALDYRLVYKDLGDSVSYRFVIFNAWDGFREHIFSINKQMPHVISNVKDSLLLEYNCGVLY